MLGCRRVAHAEEIGELTDRLLATDQLAKNQKAVPVGQRLEQFAGIVGGSLHDSGVDLDFNIHDC